MNAIRFLDDVADRRGEACAIVRDDSRSARALSFAALADRSRRLASLFVSSGLAPGDAAVVALPVDETLYAVTAALLRTGIVAVFADPAALRATVRAARAGLRVRCFVGSAGACALRWAMPELRSIPRTFTAGWWPGAVPLAAADGLPRHASPEPCAENGLALVSFTSGTTGMPKGVLRTHGVLVATQRMLADELELVPGETLLSALPLMTLVGLGAGATCVLPRGNVARPGRLDGPQLAAQIRAHAVDVVVASPAIAGRIAACALAEAPFASLRRVYVGGAPVLPSLLDAWRRAAPGATVHVLYGATEAEPIAALAAVNYGDAERRATREGAGLLAGRPVPGAEVRILVSHDSIPVGVEADATALGAVPGVEGEVVVAGPQVAPGYLAQADESAVAIHTEGRRWLRTGDAGYFDRDARLWLTGRCRDGVHAGDVTIHPVRVEAALADDDAVCRAAYLESGGLRIVVVEPRETAGPLPFERIAACVAFAKPEAIAIVGHVPVDPRHSAKVDYRRLAADIAAGRVREFHRIPRCGRAPGPGAASR